MLARMLWALLLFTFPGMTARPSLAENNPPNINYATEMDLNNLFRFEKSNKAYALGLNNYSYVTTGYGTASEASKAALKGCRNYVRKQLGKDIDPQCKLVMVNNKMVWTGDLPKPLSENFLPLPDRPLEKAQTWGDQVSPRGIVLHVHGCNGPSRGDSWSKSWFKYFTDQGFMVIQPDSFADPHPPGCADVGTATFYDKIFRLRVAQTQRTLSILRKKYPKIPLILWGHSEGGNIVQLTDYKVQGIIITGTTCWEPRPRIATPIVHLFGGRDPFSRVAGFDKTLVEKDIPKHCKGYTKTGKRQYVIVPGADHFVNITVPVVFDALDKMLASAAPKKKPQQ